MVENITLPVMPDSHMFDENGNMTIEWQEFFRGLYTRGGSEETDNLDDVIVNLIGGTYDAQRDYTNDIGNIARMFWELPSPKSYDKQIADIADFSFLKPSARTYDSDIAEIENLFYAQPSPRPIPLSEPETGKGLVLGIRTETAAYTTTRDDFNILVDTSVVNVTISLDAAAKEGQIHNVKCIDATNTCTVGRNGNNIDGVASDVILILDETVTVQADASNNWWII